MKEQQDIKVIHQQIQRLRPEIRKIIDSIEKDLRNPAFTELVVRYNADEKYFLRMIEELMAMYDGYMEATSRVISQEKVIIPQTKNPTKDEEEVDEDEIDEEELEGEGIIKEIKALDTSTLKKKKLSKKVVIDKKI